MNSLSSDLINSIAELLPTHILANVEFAGAHNEEWRLIAKDHVEKRFKLEIDIFLPLQNNQRILPDDARMTVTKVSEYGSVTSEDWDYKQRHFARIWHVTINGAVKTKELLSQTTAVLPWVLSIPTHSYAMGAGSTLAIMNMDLPRKGILSRLLKPLMKKFDSVVLSSIKAQPEMIKKLLDDLAVQGTLMTLQIINCHVEDDVLEPIAKIFNQAKEGYVEFRICPKTNAFGPEAVENFIRKWQESSTERKIGCRKTLSLTVNAECCRRFAKELTSPWVIRDSYETLIPHTNQMSALQFRLSGIMDAGVHHWQCDMAVVKPLL